MLVSFDQRLRVSAFITISLHGGSSKISQVCIDSVTKKDCLACKIILDHTMMGGGASCRGGDFGILCFESVSILREVPLNGLFHASKQRSVTNDGDSELESGRLGTHKA